MITEQVYRSLRVATRYYPTMRWASKFSRFVGWMIKTNERSPIWVRAEAHDKCPPFVLDLSNPLQRKCCVARPVTQLVAPWMSSSVPVVGTVPFPARPMCGTPERVDDGVSGDDKESS